MNKKSEISGRFKRGLFPMDFWGAYLIQIQLTAGANTRALPDVVIAGLPPGATIVRATAYFKCRTISNDNAAVNSTSGAQNIQVRKGGAGGWSNAISIVTGSFSVAATAKEPGDVLMGNNDLAALITAADTYNFQWLNSQAALANLYFNDIQTGLRIWYTV